MGSFAFHASYTDLGHLIDITSVFAMLGFPTVYAVVNIVLEDLNRYFMVGDVASKVMAPLSFIFAMFLGFWIVANRSKWEKLDSTGCLGIMVGVYVIGLVF